MFEAGESWTLILPPLHIPETSVAESRNWCFLLALQPAPGIIAWRQRSDLISPFIRNERQPGTDFAIRVLVCSIQMFQQCRSLAAVCGVVPSLPAIRLCRKPNVKIGSCQNFDIIAVLWLKSGWFFNRITVWLMLFVGLEDINLWRKANTKFSNSHFLSGSHWKRYCSVTNKTVHLASVFLGIPYLTLITKTH